MDARLCALLADARDRGASDVLLLAQCPPCVLLNGYWEDLSAETLDAAAVEDMLLALLDDKQRDVLNETADVDLAIQHPTLGRFRVNIHRQRRTLAAAIRLIPDRIWSFDDLNLPEQVQRLADLPRGLVLITGGTGTGKSTTIAAMIDRINHNRRAHVITLEDPIEYVFSNDRCIIEQREIGVDAPSFASALRHVVRQRPDIIMIGELRDLDTIATALTAVETGHLVIASLHTITAAQTIERIVDVFEPAQQHCVRIQLANTIQAVVCQTLFASECSEGVVPATEILIRTPAIARVIRDNEIHLIPGMIETGRELGMHTMDGSIAELVTAGTIPASAGLARAIDPDQLEKRLARLGVDYNVYPVAGR